MKNINALKYLSQSNTPQSCHPHPKQAAASLLLPSSVLLPLCLFQVLIYLSGGSIGAYTWFNSNEHANFSFSVPAFLKNAFQLPKRIILIH